MGEQINKKIKIHVGFSVGGARSAGAPHKTIARLTAGGGGGLTKKAISNDSHINVDDDDDEDRRITIRNSSRLGSAPACELRCTMQQ